MPIQYYIDEASSKQLLKVMTDPGHPEFKPLVAHNIQIGACMKEHSTGDGEPVPGKGNPVTVQKISGAARQFSNAEFIVIIDAHRYAGASPMQQQAMLHHGLMKIAVEEKDGVVKKAMRQPDIAEFTTTVARFGTYSEDLHGLREAMEEAGQRVSAALKTKK